MNRDSADKINEQSYQNALSIVDRAETADGIDRGIAILERLASVDYRDSAEQARTALKKRREYAAREQAAADEALRQKNAEYYQTAQEAIEKGDIDAAIEALQSIEGEYEDSAELLMQLENRRTKGRYQDAEALLENRDYEAAIEAFGALAEEGYGDSEQRLAETWYLYGDSLYDQGAYESAIEAYAAAGNYKDAGARVSASIYAAGSQASESGDYYLALSYYEQIETYEDAGRRIQECHYRKALDAMEAGDFKACRDELELAGDYGDAPSTLEKLEYIELIRKAKKFDVFTAEGYAIVDDNTIIRVQDGSVAVCKTIPPKENASFHRIIDGQYVLLWQNGNYNLIDINSDARLNSSSIDGVLSDGSMLYRYNIQLVRVDGTVVKLSDKYKYTGTIDDRYIEIQGNKGYKDYHNNKGLMDSNGKVLIKPQYHRLSYANGYIMGYQMIPHKGSEYTTNTALFDENGKMVFKPGKYQAAVGLHKDFIFVIVKGKKGEVNFRIVNEKGKTLIDLGDSMTIPVDLRVNGSYIIDDKQTHIVVRDSEFNEIISGDWSSLRIVQDTIMIVGGDDGMRLYNLHGEPVDDNVYSKMIAKPDSAYIWANKNGMWYILDLQGNVIL